MNGKFLLLLALATASISMPTTYAHAGRCSVEVGCTGGWTPPSPPVIKCSIRVSC